MKNTLYLILSWMLLVLAVLLGIVGAIVGFLVAAFFISNIVLLCMAALLLCLVVSIGLAWIAGRKISPSYRGRLALGIGVGTGVLVVLISSFTVFKPLVPSSEMSTPSVPPQTRFWDLSTGSHIAYLKIPAAHKTKNEPIIYVHGGPGANMVAAKPITDIFSPLAQEGYVVYFYDQIGGGLSARLTDIREYTVSRHVADLEGIRQQIGAEKIILIGESWGGELITHYIARYPKNVKKCIIISPGELYAKEWEDVNPGNARDRLSEESLQKLNNFIGFHVKLRLLIVELLLEINPDAAYNFVPDAEGDSLGRIYLSFIVEGMVCKPVNIPEEINIGLAFWAYIMTDKDFNVQDTDLNPLFESNNIPVLILRGECDFLKWDVTYQYKTVFPNSTLQYVEDAGHVIYLDKPEIFIDAVRSFLLDEQLQLPAYINSSPPKKSVDNK